MEVNVRTEEEIAVLQREDAPTLYAGRTDGIECPVCGKTIDIAYLSPEKDHQRGLAWCPCGAAFQLSNKEILTTGTE